MSRLTVHAREGCHLCDEMLAELVPWAEARGFDVAVVDVDTDAGLRRRYGLRVPVLTLDGEVVCHGRLDVPELERLLRVRP